MQGVQTASDHAAAASLLRWWRDAGVDMFVGDTPHDWLAVSKRTPIAAPLPPVQAATPASTRDPLPDTLDHLLTWMRDSRAVPEARWGGTRLLPTGNANADIAIVIDAPDAGDVAAGALLSGPIGALFDKMLAAIGLNRDAIWLMPFATARPFTRPPADVMHRLTEIARHQLSLVAPKRVLIMGDTPSRALIGTEVIPARGRTHSLNLGGTTVDAVATFHPRLLDERPKFKAQAWNDLQLLVKDL